MQRALIKLRPLLSIYSYQEDSLECTFNNKFGTQLIYTNPEATNLRKNKITTCKSNWIQVGITIIIDIDPQIADPEINLTIYPSALLEAGITLEIINLLFPKKKYWATIPPAHLNCGIFINLTLKEIIEYTIPSANANTPRSISPRTQSGAQATGDTYRQLLDRIEQISRSYRELPLQLAEQTSTHRQ